MITQTGQILNNSLEDFGDLISKYTGSEHDEQSCKASVLNTPRVENPPS